MIGSLAAFQDAFIAALYDQPADAAALPEAITGQPGFAVYRNTVIKGGVDALQANFPTVERLVGRSWFRAAAAVHVRQSPPASNQLIDYGADFPAFLAAFAPARDLPYLADVARLDRLWSEVFVAAEAPPLTLADLARQAPETLGQRCLRPRPSVRWAWFAEQPIYSLWRHNREQHPLPADLAWQGEGALLSRLPAGIHWQPLEAGGCAFLHACASGASLDEAAAHAQTAEPALDFTDLLGRLLGAAAFAADASPAAQGD